MSLSDPQHVRLVSKRLKAACSRALYWSENMTHTGRRYNPRATNGKSQSLEFKAAMDDVKCLSDELESLTGRPIRRYDPRAPEEEKWTVLTDTRSPTNKLDTFSPKLVKLGNPGNI